MNSDAIHRSFPKTAVSAATVLLLLCGCGSNASIPLGRVSGTVTYQGKPLDHGHVAFMPEAGGAGVPAVATIASDGSFEMTIGGGHQGAPLGKFLIAVKCCEKPNEKQAHDMTFRPKTLIPEKYADASQSGLQFEVKAGANQCPLALQ